MKARECRDWLFPKLIQSRDGRPWAGSSLLSADRGIDRRSGADGCGNQWVAGCSNGPELAELCRITAPASRSPKVRVTAPFRM